MNNELKEKIKKSMVDTLVKNINYPNCTEDAIVGQVKNMWVALEEANLTAGLSFKAFQDHAHNACLMRKMQDMFKL